MILSQPRPRRRMSLTPMIDVVFLLLVFFMLAARFGSETALVLGAGGGTAGWDGPPRLVDVTPDALRLNGVAVAERDLAAALAPLMTGADPVVMRAVDGASLQRLVSTAQALRAAGAGAVLVME